MPYVMMVPRVDGRGRSTFAGVPPTVDWEGDVPSYLALLNWTDQGIKTLNDRDVAAGIETTRQAIEAAGGRLIFWYMLMGEYDLAVLAELPDDDVAARLVLNAGIGGNFRSRTMRAFTEEETIALIGSLP